jgi:prephenate dehydratase
VAVSSQAARVRVTSEFPVAVDYRLLGNGAIEQVAEVWSRPEALRACAKWLAKRLPDAKLVEMPSTAAAVQGIAESGRRDVAAIGSPMAGEIYGVATVAPVEMERGAVTRFWLVGSAMPGG